MRRSPTKGFGSSDKDWRTLPLALSLLLLLLSAGSPAKAGGRAGNLLANPGFEDGATNGWFVLGPGSLTATATTAHGGAWSGLASGRTSTWNGPAQNIVGVVQHGQTYALTCWVLLQNTSSDLAWMTVKKVDGTGTSYDSVGSAIASDQNWVKLSGSYTLQVVGSLSELVVYVEGPAAGVSFYVDDAEMRQVDWVADANTRIESIRKRDVQTLVVDNLGNGMPEIDVAAQQIKHHFAFGSAMRGAGLPLPAYQSFFLDHFEWAVFENECKWSWNEPVQGNVSYADADYMHQFCKANDLRVRAHTVFWAAVEQVQPWVQALDNGDLEAAIQDRLNGIVNHFKGKFEHWDVNNEMLHGSFFADRLGSGVRLWMFQQARAIDPGVRLFVNDYNAISGVEAAAYKAHVTDLVNQGAPVDAIGVQGHFDAVVDPITVFDRLEGLSSLGMPIWVTEYDSLNSDEQARADNLEALYRTAFSHPAVEGVLMWGFWAGDHWRGPNAAIVNQDWTLNAAGERYEQLLGEWTTSAEGESGPGGLFSFRGFHGTYEVTVTDGSLAALHTITVPPGEGTLEFPVALDPDSCVLAGEVEELSLVHDTGTGETSLSWLPPSSPPGMAVLYDVLRSAESWSFAGDIACVENGTPNNETVDNTTPSAGAAFFYLARAKNRCGLVDGPLGSDSEDVPRDGGPCDGSE